MQVKSFTDLDEWRKTFTALSREQVSRLRNDVSVHAQLERDDLQVIWRQWNDVARAFGSDEGKNTTDLTLFAVGPETLWEKAMWQFHF